MSGPMPTGQTRPVTVLPQFRVERLTTPAAVATLPASDVPVSRQREILGRITSSLHTIWEDDLVSLVAANGRVKGLHSCPVEFTMVVTSTEGQMPWEEYAR